METHGKSRPEHGRFRVTWNVEQGEEGEGREHVQFEEDMSSLVLHFQNWETDDGSVELRNYGFSYSITLGPDGGRDMVTAEDVQRVVDQYPYWLSLARAVVVDPLKARPTRTLRRRGKKPSQPGRSPAFLAQVADEYVWRFDAGQDAVTEIAQAHMVTPGTVSKWLTKANDPRVTERRASRYRRRAQPLDG